MGVGCGRGRAADGGGVARTHMHRARILAAGRARPVGLTGRLGVRVVPTDRGPLGRPRHGAGLADVLDTARLPRLIDRHSDGGERRLKDPAAMTAAAQPTADAAGADRGRTAALQSESGSESTADSCTGCWRPDPVCDLDLGRPHFPSRQSLAPDRRPVRRCACLVPARRRAQPWPIGGYSCGGPMTDWPICSASHEACRSSAPSRFPRRTWTSTVWSSARSSSSVVRQLNSRETRALSASR